VEGDPVKSTLSPLQQRVLEILAPMSPRWTLSGGGALAGFHCAHRTTRDLDLFWHGQATLPEAPQQAERLLVAAGMQVATIQRSPTVARLKATQGDDGVVLDFDAEPVPTVEAPAEHAVGRARILVDTRHEILVNKLGTLLNRAEPRDLVDLRELLASGGDLRRALLGAARKDGGFSALTVGWSLEGFDVIKKALALGMSERDARELDAFRQRLRDEIAALAKP